MSSDPNTTADDPTAEDVQGARRRTTDAGVDVEDNPPDREQEQEPTDEDEDLISWQDVTYQRDASGQLAPVRVDVEEFADVGIQGSAKALPMTDRQRKTYVEDLMDPDSDKEEISDAELADLFESNLIAPDLTNHPECSNSGVTERFVAEEMSQYFQDACYIAILLASDEYDVVRLMRSDLKPGEIDMAVKMQQAENGEGNRPKRNRG